MISEALEDANTHFTAIGTHSDDHSLLSIDDSCRYVMQMLYILEKRTTTDEGILSHVPSPSELE